MRDWLLSNFTRLSEWSVIYYIIQREILEFEIVLGYSHLEL